MKKVIAILLLLGMLLSMGVVASASGVQVEKMPFYLVNFMDDVTDYDNIYARVNFNTSTYQKGDAGITVTVDFQGQKSSKIPKIAQILKEEFDKRPVGTRYIDFPKFINMVVEPEAMIYLDKGAQLYADWLEEFFKEYKAIGGQLDGVMLDVEYNGIYGYYINKAYTSGGTGIDDDGREVEVVANKQIYNQIVEHPNYATRVRPKLEERGFQFSTPNGEQSEIYGISVRGSANEGIWNAVTHNLLCEYMNEACEPILKYYPDVLITNYIFASGKSWLHTTGQKGGVSIGGNTDYAGTVANQNYYVRRPFKQFHDTSKAYLTPSYYNGAVYEDTSYNSFMFEVNTFKDMYASMEGGRISAWIAGFNYKHRNAPANSTRLTPYYSEGIFHIGLLNPELFLGYIVGPRDTDNNDDGYDYESNMLVCSELLAELTRLVGTADRKAISVPTQWNSGFVLSGMYAGGRNIWRITPNTLEGTSLEDFKVKDKAPTFKINGQTVIFPQGRIIEDSKVSYIGTCGYWVETPANVTPVVVNDADRYEKYPAYEENFESYKEGTVFDKATAAHKDAWKTSGSLTIKTEGNDKALAMTGSSSIKNVKLPQNVTAGDSYAKQQVWELTVTVPSSGELKLLACAENDGGIKIADGKVYYDNAGTYAELSGVTLTAGSTYKLTRTVDFRASTFNCDYTVFDANGNSLGSVTDIPMISVELPVKTIENASVSVSDGAYIDDYRLRAVGVTTDFKLYDVSTGMQLTDTTAARTQDTAYRVSWMNATSEYKVANVYNDGKFVAQIRMAPGADGVLTGIVEGNSKLSVKTGNGKAANLPDYDSGNFGWIAGEENPVEETEGTIPLEEETVTEPSGGVEATNPSEAPAPTNPGLTKPGAESGPSGGVIAVIAIAAAVALGAGGFALYWSVIKPKAKQDN